MRGVCVYEGIRLRIYCIRFEQRELEANGMDLGHQRIANLDCVWEGLVVRFIIYHPLDTPGAVLACSGSHQVGFRV